MESGGQHTSQLRLSSLQYGDTGEFLCIYANQSRTSTSSISAYVYVQGLFECLFSILSGSFN